MRVALADLGCRSFSVVGFFHSALISTIGFLLAILIAADFVVAIGLGGAMGLPYVGFILPVKVILAIGILASLDIFIVARRRGFVAKVELASCPISFGYAAWTAAPVFWSLVWLYWANKWLLARLASLILRSLIRPYRADKRLLALPALASRALSLICRARGWLLGQATFLERFDYSRSEL